MGGIDESEIEDSFMIQIFDGCHQMNCRFTQSALTEHRIKFCSDLGTSKFVKSYMCIEDWGLKILKSERNSRSTLIHINNTAFSKLTLIIKSFYLVEIGMNPDAIPALAKASHVVNISSCYKIQKLILNQNT